MDAVWGCGDCPPCPGFKHGGTCPTGEVLSASCLLHDGTGIQSSHLFFLHNQPKAPLEDEGQEEMFMKHLFTMLLALVATTASAQTFEVDGIYYNILSEDDRTVEVIGGPGLNEGDIVIPAEMTYDGSTYSVTTIGNRAFNGCSALTSVSMPEVTTIGVAAFMYCNALTSVSMPEVTTIGDNAFEDCFSLASVSMPEATTIGVRAFYGCSGLVSVSMPSVTAIDEVAFWNCYALTSVEMPAVTTIGSNAFNWCKDLKSISMPSVMTIGDGAFNNCDALTSVNIPESCTSIAGNPFQGCQSLEEIVVDENNPNYSSMDGVLYDKYMSTLIACPEKKSSIDIPSSVTTIGDRAFHYCSALTSVSMPSVTTIDSNAFFDCSALTSVYMPEVTTIGYKAFSDCESLTSVSMPSVTTIGNGAFSDCRDLTSVSMPSVTTIGNGAFSDCRDLTSVDIPSSCTSIAGNPFQGCQSLEEIVVDENNPNYSSMDGVLYDKDKTTLIGWPAAEGDISIMPSVTTIGNGAFSGCDALTSVSMPAVTKIGESAFSGCNYLRSVEMPKATTIGESAFNNCYDLTSVSMPSVTAIGDWAFIWCNALTSVSMPSVTTIGDEAFNNCDALTSVSMPSVTTIGYRAFSFCSALTSVSMPSVTTIGESAFVDCRALTSVDLPASVKMIGNYAFYGCSGLTSVYCRWEEPLECEPEFTSEVLVNATLYVPTGTVDAYSSTFPWSEFINIEERDYSGIADTPQSEVTVKVIDGAIVIEGGDGTASAPVVEVYSAGGLCIYRGTDSSIGGLPHGVYVVKVGDVTQKVAL